MGVSRRDVSNPYSQQRVLTCHVRIGACKYHIHTSSANCFCVSPRPHAQLICTDGDFNRTSGWKFYLLFILLTFIGGIVVWVRYPDTRNMPLEELAALFGDLDEVAVYQAEIEVDPNSHAIVDHHDDKSGATHVEKATVDV